MAETRGYIPDSEKEGICYVSAQSARNFAVALLESHEVPSENAEIVAKCLVEADLRGVDSHGINRLPSYLARLRTGVLDGHTSPKLSHRSTVIAQVDGNNTFGALSAALGMDCAIEMAQLHGIGIVSIKNSNHFGMSASFVLQAIERGMMSMVFTNSSPAMAAWGSAERLLGVSPIACGAPGGKELPFVLDMAPSIAARGKVYKALRRGEDIPLDWALNAEGKSTTNAADALEGMMLPIGGPKGSALSIMMDVFSGVISGSAFAGEVVNPHDPSRPANVGHFMLAMKPDIFIELQDFKDRMDYLYKRIVGSRRAEDANRIYFPGEIEFIQQREREVHGIPFHRNEINLLNKEAQKHGVQKLCLMH